MAELPSAIRRRLIQIAGAFFSAHALGLSRLAVAASASVGSAAERRTLAAFLDTLLPRDALSASATGLGVDEGLWAYAREDGQFGQLLALGCTWLDQTQGPLFHALAEAQQIAIVRWMADSDWQQIPRRFYELTRQLAVEIYYSHPASWGGLALQRPPQPIGYPPPWR